MTDRKVRGCVIHNGRAVRSMRRAEAVEDSLLFGRGKTHMHDGYLTLHNHLRLLNHN